MLALHAPTLSLDQGVQSAKRIDSVVVQLRCFVALQLPK